MVTRKIYVFLLIIICFSTYAKNNLVALGCRPPANTQLPQFIVGYGSLMQEESKRTDSKEVGVNVPVELKGFERGWIEHSEDKHFGTTYLGVKINPNAKINAVYFKLNAPTDINNYDQREDTYCRVAVSQNAIQPLAGKSLPKGQYWIYTTLSKTTIPSPQYPLAQSYVDIFLSGCFELEKKYHLHDFAKNCVKTTRHWSISWVNDRIHPRTAYDSLPYAAQIDSLLSETVPEYFNQVKIE